jgi:23S rRNA pseudouridine1911/1915/1917 synthase
MSLIPSTDNARPHTPVEYDPEEYGFDETDDIRIYEHHRIRVDPGQEPMRVDLFLTNRIKHLSRSRIQNAALAGFIKVNDKPAKSNLKIRPYDEVSIILPYPPQPDLIPEDIPLDIHYEDEHLILVNKPAGLVCHPGCGNYRGTLVNALLYYFNEGARRASADPDSIRPGLVHRIDKDTTGLLVVAKTEQTYNSLARQFFERTTHRNYWALVWGDVAQDKGTIVGHIGRSAQDRKRFVVYEDGSMGKHAVTHYEVLQRYGVATLVRCKLETGRTHQIRVHFKYLGHTLFADNFYGGNRILRGKQSRFYQRFMQENLDMLNRQALHAKNLGFTHPGTGEYKFFECPIPADMARVLRRLADFAQVEPLPEFAHVPREINLAPHAAHTDK